MVRVEDLETAVAMAKGVEGSNKWKWLWVVTATNGGATHRYEFFNPRPAVTTYNDIRNSYTSVTLEVTITLES